MFGSRAASRHLLLFICSLLFAISSTVCAEVITIEVSGWVPQRDLPIIEAFEAAHPNIKVNYRNIVGTEQIFVHVAAGDAPDVMTLSWAVAGDLVRNGVLEDLTPWIESAGNALDLDDFFPGALEPGILDGRRYTLPAVLGARGLYINVDYFNESGLDVPPSDWTWEDFAAIAKRLTRFDDTGEPVQFGFQNHSFATWMSIVYAYGGRMLSPGFDTPVFYSPETVAGLSLFRRMVVEDRSAGGAFRNANVGMVIRPAETVRTWLADVQFKWQGYVLPQGPAGRALLGGAHQLAISKDSKNKEAAWEFVKFYTGPQAQRIAAEFSTVPVRRSVFHELASSGTERLVLAQQMDSWVQFTDRLYDEINRVWAPVINQQLLQGTISPDEAAILIQEGLEAIW